MPPIDHYLKSFTRLNLNRAPGRIWTPATKKKAPHNPLLLLALLDLFFQGQLETNFIKLTPDLNDLFTLYWSRVVPLAQKSSVVFPFLALLGRFWGRTKINYWKITDLSKISLQKLLIGLFSRAKLAL